MGKDVEVRTRLRLDDLASALLAKIKSGFVDADKGREQAQEGLGSFAHQAAASALAFNAAPAIHQVVEWGKSFFEAGQNAQDADQAIAGLISSVQGLPWEDSHDLAERFGDDLDDIAVDAHAATRDVGDAFQRMVEIVGASAEGLQRAKKETADLALVASNLGKSTTQLAGEYAFMAEGTVKVKSQLFQLLQPTGIFGKDVKKASEYWASITEESRVKLLAYGIEQVSSKLQTATPTMRQLVTSLEDIYDIAKEKFGQEVVEELMGGAGSLLHDLVGYRGEIDKTAASAGREVGRWVKEAAQRVKEGYAYVVVHYAELKEAVVSAFTTAKEVVSWIIAHKEEIAFAFGAKAVLPTAGRLAGAIATTASGGVSGLGIAGTGGGLLAGGAAVAAFAAAVGAWVLAIDQWQKLMAATEGGKSEGERDQGARERMFQQMIDSPQIAAASERSIKAFEEVRAAYVATAQELGQDARAAGELADRAWEAHRAVRRQVEGVEKLAGVFDELDKTGGIGGLDVSAPVKAIDQAFGGAMGAHNAAVEQYIADVLSKSKSLQGAFLSASGLTAEGFEELAKLVEGKSKDFADRLREVAGMAGGGPAAKPEAPKVVFNGANITIKQDFRDQDPDRVAILLRSDLGKAASNRYQALTGSPFGA